MRESLSQQMDYQLSGTKFSIYEFAVTLGSCWPQTKVFMPFYYWNQFRQFLTGNLLSPYQPHPNLKRLIKDDILSLGLGVIIRIYLTLKMRS